MAQSREVANTQAATKVPAVVRPSITDDELRGITSFAEAAKLVETLYGSVIDVSDEFGTGFTILKDKDKLIDQPFVILQFREIAGDFGDAYTSALIVTADNEKYVINDGGTGIADQLISFATQSNRYGGFKVTHGLRKSEYDTCHECGKPRSKDEVTCSNVKCDDASERRGRGVTYYLAV